MRLSITLRGRGDHKSEGGGESSLNYVGVDVSKKFFDCWDPRKRVTGRVENTQKGIEGFLSLLGEEDALVVDPAGGY
ncbi:MAG: hypothetical protein KIH10_16750 [Candidatus Freyarchaeota archaeon]|nr:hypothetical protein [Candidatus Jordarchaeia archaeon]MBS7280556.1 hypothetical protein [Candidatus Jordarchaeia archaeon]